MTCYRCNKELVESTNTYFVDLGECMVIVKNVPCLKCEKCGEVFYNDNVARRLEEIVQQVRSLVTEVAIVEYNSAA